MEPAELESTLLNKIHLFFVKITTKTIFIPAFLLWGTFYFFMVLVEEEIKNKYTTLKLLDLRGSYSANDVYELLDALGGKGRGLYFIFEVIDLLMPITTVIVFASVITYLYQNSFDKANPVQKINLLPLIAYFADLMENFFIILLLALYPSEITTIAEILPFLTWIKHTSHYMEYGIMITGLVILIAVKIQSRRQQASSS